ncbi:hypothetical protein GHT06_020810 [Daphnia sinensis]|uniref:Sulfotransferase domain-containing protein n=1 Tax=Daphnia sinensis TaxID=1820382 RepID=A0AAD5KZA3_9CRUS|nr:hypothetical protein GHT06_020810 [Daphnia sinensis]
MPDMLDPHPSAFVAMANEAENCKKLNGRAETRPRLEINFIPVPGTNDGQFQKDFPAYTDGLVYSNPGRYVVMPEYPKKAEIVYNLKPRPDDVYVLTFPKCGTTWMQELVWLVINQCDFEKAKTPLNIRSPFLEMNYMLPKVLTDKYERDAIVYQTGIPGISKFLEILDYWNLRDVLRPHVKKLVNMICGHVMRDVEEMEQMTETRIIKSHLPLYLLNPELLDTSKVVYVARNPKDVLVSYFHYHKLIHFHQFTGDLESFADYFMSDKVYASPFFPHLLDAWSKRHHPNLLFVFYEDLKRDLRGEIQKVVSFLGKSLSEEQLTKLTEHLRVDQFAKNEAVNYEVCKELGFMNNSGHFIRKGKTGDWKNHFSPELNARIDLWIETNLQGTDLSFVTELDQQD